MPAGNAQSYDQFPYKSLPFRESRPDATAAIATVMGMNPVPADRCRVLELGCSSGGNLIPLAEQFPNSQFLGLDFSASELAGGQAAIAQLGLPNIRLEQRDIRDSHEALGQFDFIVAHGVFSWVEPDVQDRLLAICAANLAEQGVAYVSYNTYPGWAQRGTARDIMRYHMRRMTDNARRAATARQAVDLFVESLAALPANAYAAALREEQKNIAGLEDYVLIHDHLWESNHPLYFHQFIQRASSHGLQFLAEANFPSTFSENLPPPAARMVAANAKDRIEAGQYTDFLTNRCFRQTLLCHADINLDPTRWPSRALEFYVASPAKAEGPVDITSATPARFRATGSSSITTSEPALKAIMLRLEQIWPLSAPMSELLALAREHAGFDERTALAAMGRCHSSGLMEFSLHPAMFTTAVSQRPVVSAYARWQAGRGDAVSNRRHELVRLDELARQMLRHLDGATERAVLPAILGQIVDRGQLVVSEQGQPIHDPNRAKQLLADRLDAILVELGRAALLVS